MRKFKHIKTGEEAKLIEGHLDFYGVDGAEVMPARFIENSCDWQEILEKDYKILEIQGKYGAISSYIETLDGGLKDKSIFKVKRLSDGELFTIEDSYKYKCNDVDEVYQIKGIIIRQNCIWLQHDLNKPTHGTTLEYAEKVKTPLLVTHDGVDIFEGDAIFVPQRKGDKGLYDDILEFKANSLNTYNLDVKIFAKKENAKEYIKFNKPQYSLNDIKEATDVATSSNSLFCVYGDAFLKNLTNGKA